MIVGGGPAGAAAAILLAKGGAKPLLLERTSEPHDVVCGGFLGWDGLAALEGLGIDPAALGAHPISRLRLAAAGRIAEAELPHLAAGLSRRTLDTVLLARAATAGAAIERGVRVSGAAPGTIRLADTTTIEAQSIFLATGKHDLRGLARPHDRAGSVGLRVRLAPSAKLTRALSGTIELHLFEGGYAGLLLQDDGSANLCLSIAPGRLAAAGGRPEGLIAALAQEAPLLSERFGAGVPGKWIAIAGVPYGWRASDTVAGLFRLGDQGAVIASLAGDGVAIALSSGRRAAETWLQGGDAPAYQSAFARHARRSLAAASLLRSAAERPATAMAMLALLRRFPSLGALSARLTRIGH